VVVEVARRRWASWGRLCCGGVRRRPAASPNAPSKPKQARHYTENLTGRADALNRLPETAWTPAYDGDGEPREGADVAELTGLLNLTGWPARTRVIARREVPHPGAQLRPVDHDGRRITCFPPTPAAGNCLTPNRGTTAAPAPKTASAGSKTLAWPTCRSTQPHPTRSGWPSFFSPATCSPRPRRYRYPGRCGWPNPRRCACGCSPSPGA
jgi:hypothetical protein